MNSFHSQKFLKFHRLPLPFIAIGALNASLNSSIILFHWILRTRGLFIEMGVLHTSLHRYQNQPSPSIVYHTEKFKMHLIAHLVYIPDSMESIVLFKMSKYSLHDSSDLTLLLVTLLLTIRRASVAIGLVQYTTINTFALKCLFLRAVCIDLVSKHRSFVPTKQFVKFLRIMNTGSSKTSLADDTRTLIYSNMSFITVISSLTPLKKIRIIILLGRALLFTRFFVSHTPLLLIRATCRLDNTGIYESSSSQDEFFFFQNVNDVIKELLQNSRLRQPFSESPYGGKIRNLLLSQSRIDKANPKKSLKGETTYQSIFQLRIAQIIKVLKKQTFQRINDWHLRTTPTRGGVQGLDFSFQLLPVQELINLFQKLVTTTSFPASIKSTVQNRKSRFRSANHCLILLSYCFV